MKMTMKCRRMFFLSLVCGLAVGKCRADLKVDGDLPAGNVIVDGIKGDVVKLRQDLRDSNMWFYWAFRVRGAAGRTVKFKVVGTGPEIVLATKSRRR